MFVCVAVGVEVGVSVDVFVGEAVSGRVGVLVAVSVGVAVGVCVGVLVGVFVAVPVCVAVCEAVAVCVTVEVLVAVAVIVAVNVAVAVDVAVGVRVNVGEEIGVFVAGRGVLVGVRNTGKVVGYDFMAVGVAASFVGVLDTLAMKAVDVAAKVADGCTCVAVAAGKVEVTRTRGSIVMVGTGERSETSRVDMRSCATPVPGRSMMICCRMSSSICGTVGI